MNGKELLTLFPKAVIEKSCNERLEMLAQCNNEEEFLQTLLELAKDTKVIWIYGFPRTGSTWLCKKFFPEFTKEIFNESFELFQCNSVSSTPQRMYVGTELERDWMEIHKRLSINRIVADRLILAVCKQVVFKMLYDFYLVPQLLELFPMSRFIWLTRDGRDSVASCAKPDLNHWPRAPFPWLGENDDERFHQAHIRWLKCTTHQIETQHNHPNNILRVKYEDFIVDFKKASKKVLAFSGFEYSDDVINDLSENFKPRHAMWKEWEDWKKQCFLDNGGEKANKMLGYSDKNNNAKFSWEEMTH